jgi:hypothetical protein
MPRKKIKIPSTVGEVITEMGGLYKDARSGTLDTLDASRLASILTAIRYSLEAGTIEDRLDEIEKEMRARYD